LKLEGSVFELRIAHINTISTLKSPVFHLFIKNLGRASGSMTVHAPSAHCTHWMCSFEGRGAAESWNKRQIFVS